MFTLKSRSIIKQPKKAKNPLLAVRENEDQAVYQAESVTEDQIIDKALEIVTRRMNEKGQAMSSSTLALQFFKLHFAKQPYESFCALYLDNQHRVIDIEELFVGTIDGASVYPREVLTHALAKNAAAIMFSHNHPSGKAEPSEADKFITQQLKTALKTVDIRVLDHFVIGGAEHFSFAEHGLI